MRYVVGVSNLYEGKVAIFVVDAPTPLFALKGVLFDLVNCTADDLGSITDKSGLDDLSREYDVILSDPMEVHEQTPLKRPDPSFFDDCDSPIHDIVIDDA